MFSDGDECIIYYEVIDLFEDYLRMKGLSIVSFSKQTGIPISTLRNLNKIRYDKWKIRYLEVLSNVLNKNIQEIIEELKNMGKNVVFADSVLDGKYDIENRRYIGSKNKLIAWIKSLIIEETEGTSFLDLFAGTGVVSKNMLDLYNSFIINDFLYSNEVIYKAFFSTEPFNKDIIKIKEQKYQKLTVCDENYFSKNYGGKFFSNNDATVIGEIREDIEKDKSLSDREKSILLASLVYSCDKVANTVGHYDAYRKKIQIEDRFKFELIKPIDTTGKDIFIHRVDANELVKKIKADVVFIDPPYNSRQYSRFYHLLENLVKWTKPELEGVAMKPPVENMSEYSKTKAPEKFDELIQNIDAKYIVVTYNNTYASKSNSSKNKITHDQIINSLSKVGSTRQFEQDYQFFNAGKTDLKDHKEFVFITKVGIFNEK